MTSAFYHLDGRHGLGRNGLSRMKIDGRPLTELDRPLRVVHLGPCFVRGGSEQQAIDLAHFLDPDRIELVKCLVTTPSLVDERVTADMPVPVEIAGREQVREAARDCDVLLFWGLELDDWLSDCRPPLCVYLAHGDGPWSREMLAGSARVTDHVVAVSRRVQQEVCRGFPATVILNGIDASRLAQSRPRREVRASLGFADTDFVLGCIGRFSPEKRIDLLLEVVAFLPPSFKALIVGWGPLEQDLHNLANHLIPGRFAFTMAHDYLGDIYQAMDALCLLSDSEGFALVVLEAMMCERPVIATPVGSVMEVIEDRVNGIVVHDRASACSAARLLRDHPHWARGMAAEARVYAQEHGHALRMARDYEDLLARLWKEKYPNQQPRRLANL